MIPPLLADVGKSHSQNHEWGILLVNFPQFVHQNKESRAIVLQSKCKVQNEKFSVRLRFQLAKQPVDFCFGLLVVRCRDYDRLGVGRETLESGAGTDGRKTPIDRCSILSHYQWAAPDPAVWHRVRNFKCPQASLCLPCPLLSTCFLGWVNIVPVAGNINPATEPYLLMLLHIVKKSS